MVTNAWQSAEGDGDDDDDVVMTPGRRRPDIATATAVVA